ncbi:MAG: glycosyltransferase [Lentisphaeria bacterium]|nr:glycosyltransferase [Lentisphaeria bacterium]
MRVALLHYWLTNMRGGEMVLAELCELFPEADIFTHAFAADKVASLFSRHKVRETFIGRLPGARRNCQKYLPLMPAALARLDLREYDLLISSESGPVKGVKKAPGAKHICYCHTPMRYLYDMYDVYYRDAGPAGKLAMKLFRKPLTRYDLRSAESVDLFIANSTFVAERIRRIYGRESTVVHPPVDVEFFAQVPPGTPKEDFYLVAGACVPYKHPELAIEACRRMGRKLVVAGSGPLWKKLRKNAGAEAVFIPSPSKEELRRLYASARALLFPGIEDFGIVPVECQAAGTPVIACGAGGALDTVRPGRSGLFFEEQTVETLCRAIEEFEGRRWESALCRESAERFTREVFRRKFMLAAAPFLPSADEKR